MATMATEPKTLYMADDDWEAEVMRELAAITGEDLELSRDDQPFLKKLLDMGIVPFTDRSVGELQNETLLLMEPKGKRQLMSGLVLLAGFLGLGLLNKTLITVFMGFLGAVWAVPLWSCALLASALGFYLLAFNGVGNLMAHWHEINYSGFNGSIPREAQDLAYRIARAEENAYFRIAVIGKDPLLIACEGGERYYIAAWNVPPQLSHILERWE